MDFAPTGTQYNSGTPNTSLSFISLRVIGSGNLKFSLQYMFSSLYLQLLSYWMISLLQLSSSQPLSYQLFFLFTASFINQVLWGNLVPRHSFTSKPHLIIFLHVGLGNFPQFYFNPRRLSISLKYRLVFLSFVHW